MQTYIFLKPLVTDQDKKKKGSLVLYFIFCDVTCNPRTSEEEVATHLPSYHCLVGEEALAHMRMRIGDVNELHVPLSLQKMH